MTAGALLALEDGTLFYGDSVGVFGKTVGEVVFNTAMTGYQEILTDPSYARQIVTLTYPHIGNTGTNSEDSEADRIYASGLVIRDVPNRVSNWRAGKTLPEFLEQHGLVAIAEVDTRRLTRLIRERGAQRGCIIAGHNINSEASIAEARSFPGLRGMDLAREVTTERPYDWSLGGWDLEGGFRDAPPLPFRVLAYDFGIKRNILRMLVDRGCKVTVVPATTPASQVMEHRPHGVFLSNGPGDPEPCDYAIRAIAEILDNGVPIFGICLGHQLMALASSAKTKKMKFGHHGANHPVQDINTGQVLITSQNHGFMVDDKLPPSLILTHKSLFDGSVQGIKRVDRPAFSFQGHPEASPGPHDIGYLFDGFIDLMRSHNQDNHKATEVSAQSVTGHA
jgi:carbamoyl-phosphate synthase small subunit